MTEVGEEFEYDYESLGANSTASQNAIAGALAGIGEHCLMYPVDSIKVKSNPSNPPIFLF
jgi:solute carrier family 25 iron transporter 28/37